jgi:hypothetical protein
MHVTPVGIYTFELFDKQNKLIDSWESKNGTTIVGKNHILGVTFGGSGEAAQISPWYIGLIDNAGSPTLDEADTLASHSGWTEATAYTGNRHEWVDAAAASKIKATTTASAFVASSTLSIYGAFLCSAATGTSGVLMNTTAFDAVRAVPNGSTLNVSYSIQM